MSSEAKTIRLIGTDSIPRRSLHVLWIPRSSDRAYQNTQKARLESLPKGRFCLQGLYWTVLHLGLKGHCQRSSDSSNKLNQGADQRKSCFRVPILIASTMQLIPSAFLTTLAFSNIQCNWSSGEPVSANVPVKRVSDYPASMGSTYLEERKTVDVH